jgi:hypothetical protein
MVEYIPLASVPNDGILFHVVVYSIYQKKGNESSGAGSNSLLKAEI